MIRNDYQTCRKDGRLAERTACFFVENKIIKVEDESVYFYGMELLLSTIFNFILALTVSLLTRSFIPCFINLAAFLTIRVNAGGYHADTHLGCMVILAVVLLIFIVVEKNLPISSMMICSPIMIILSDIIIIGLSPVEHPNKPLNDVKKKKLKIKSIVWAVLWTLFGLIFLFVNTKISFYSTSGMLTIALAMIAEKIKEKVK